MIRRLARGALRSLLGSRVRTTPPAASPGSASSAAAPPPAPTPPPKAAAAPPPARPAPTAPPDEPPEVEVDHSTLRTWREEGRSMMLLDIRESMEVRNGVLAGARWIPMNSVPNNLDALPRDQVIIVYCAAGARSYGVAHWLREQGFAQAWSLSGGAGAGVSAGFAWQAEGPR